MVEPESDKNVRIRWCGKCLATTRFRRVVQVTQGKKYKAWVCSGDESHPGCGQMIFEGNRDEPTDTPWPEN
jgi:hypothetical protein